jgi:hypothetical protein
VTDKCNQLQQANLAVRMLLEFLPENILEKFSWHPWSSFSAENLQLLYRKQRRMKWLEAIALDRDIIEDLEKWSGFPGVFENVRKLGLYPDSREVLNMCAALVKRTPKVEKITIHASFDDDADQPPIPLRELNDSSTGPGTSLAGVGYADMSRPRNPNHLRPHDAFRQVPASGASRPHTPEDQSSVRRGHVLPIHRL